MRNDLIRTFIAVETSDEVKRELSEVLSRLGNLPFSIKWVELDNVHLTLSFLGYVEKDKLNDLYQAVEDGSVGMSPFVIKPTRIVCFPSFKKPRVIVLGLKGEVFLLEKLQKQIEKSLLKAGFQPKVKRSHLTLGRVRREIKRSDRLKLGRKLVNFPVDFKQVITVDSVAVFKSDLFPQGPVYTKLKEFKLSQSEPSLML
ncbi:RNA 2',3'-cyclic phosphodiesterase [subsurface metagenome]